MPWREILTLVLTALSVAAIAFVHDLWTKYIKPWLIERKLYDAAVQVVYAVEAELGRGNGESKLIFALNRMHERGYIISDSTKESIRAAWLELDMSMVSSGVKELDD